MPTPPSHSTRREFLRTTAAAGAALWASAAPRGLWAAGSDALRVGLVGCGGRGTTAAINCVEAAPGVTVVALADLFADRIEDARRRFTAPDKEGKPPRHAAHFDLSDERCFVGFDAYEKLLKTNVNLVILATPPAFRPIHLEACIKAGKHVFMEKPVAVDPVGIRSIMASADLAKEKGLAIVAGTQRRHEGNYVETVRRIRNGAIGELVGGACYWNQGSLWVRKQEPGWSDMEWQIRNWLYFTWCSGDHIVEQHVHNIDVINWCFGTLPVKCLGMGGRQVRTGKAHGNIFDHFSVEFEYPNGARVLSMCRQIPGSSHRVSEFVAGTKGTAHPRGDLTIEGQPWKYRGKHKNPYVQEHTDLIESIRAGEPLNEGRQVAGSTLCAIAGRMSAYTGKELKLDWALKASKLDLVPKTWAFGDHPVEPVAVPGQTKLI